MLIASKSMHCILHGDRQELITTSKCSKPQYVELKLKLKSKNKPWTELNLKLKGEKVNLGFEAQIGREHI